jgi:hypothetical protein
MEKLSPEVEQFIVWTHKNDWWYNPILKKWIHIAGRKNKTTQQLFKFYLKQSAKS